MIRSFRDGGSEDIFNGKNSKAASKRLSSSLHRIARRKLDMIDAAIRLDNLKVPPGNQLESLKGDRKGQHSIRINDQFRICFEWIDGNADNVEITGYH